MYSAIKKMHYCHLYNRDHPLCKCFLGCKNHQCGSSWTIFRAQDSQMNNSLIIIINGRICTAWAGFLQNFEEWADMHSGHATFILGKCGANRNAVPPVTGRHINLYI